MSSDEEDTMFERQLQEVETLKFFSEPGDRVPQLIAAKLFPALKAETEDKAAQRVNAIALQKRAGIIKAIMKRTGYRDAGAYYFNGKYSTLFPDNWKARDETSMIERTEKLRQLM